MKTNWILIVVVLFLAVGAYYLITRNADIANDSTSNSIEAVGTTLGTFTGELPCADCPGITETLTLYQNANGNPTTYTMTDVYQDRDTSFTTEGTWIMEQGAPFDETATLYVLTPSDNSQTTYLWKENETTLTRLDQDMQKIDSPFNQSLTLRQ